MRVVGCIFIILPVILYFLFRNKSDDFFSPKTAFSFLYILKVVLSVLELTNVNGLRFDEDDGFLYFAIIDDNVFFNYCILQSISYVLILVGIDSVQKRTRNSQISNVKYSSSLARSFMLWGVLFFIIGLLGFVLIMRRVGGLVYFFSNLHLRRYLVRDLDFETMLLSFANKGPMLIVFSKKYSGKKITLIDILLIVLTGIMVGLGGRKALIMLVIECLFIYHFAIKRIRIKNLLKPSYILLAITLFLFFSVFSKFRREGAMEEFLNNPIEFYQENTSGSVLSTIAGESYVPFYISIVYYFQDHPYWYGSSFKGLLTAPVPSSIYPEKPPVDDGMYLYSIAHGNTSIKPVMPARMLDGTSWPLETFGSMYANFGPIGVIIGMIILGLIIGWSYKKMIDSNYSFLWLLMYVTILFSFELSTLRLFQVFISFITLAIVAYLANRIRI